jgi:hypothetical protein
MIQRSLPTSHIWRPKINRGNISETEEAGQPPPQNLDERFEEQGHEKSS